MSDGLSPEQIAETLAEIDEFVRSSAAKTWTVPTDLLGSRLNGGGRECCPLGRAHLLLPEARTYPRLPIPCGPLLEPHRSARSSQARVPRVRLALSSVDALRDFT